MRASSFGSVRKSFPCGIFEVKEGGWGCWVGGLALQGHPGDPSSFRLVAVPSLCSSRVHVTPATALPGLLTAQAHPGAVGWAGALWLGHTQPAAEPAVGACVLVFVSTSRRETVRFMRQTWWLL